MTLLHIPLVHTGIFFIENDLMNILFYLILGKMALVPRKTMKLFI